MLARLPTLVSLTATAFILLGASTGLSEGSGASNEGGVSPRSEVALEAGGFDDSTVQKPCLYPAVGGAVFSGTQRQILFGADPPFPVPQTYTFGEQYGELVRANISAPSLKISSFPVICGYSPRSAPTALPLLVCVEKDFQATRDVYVTHWTRDCVATDIEVIGYEPGRFVGRMSLTRTGSP